MAASNDVALVKLQSVAKTIGRNRQAKRAIFKALRLEQRHLAAPDRAKEYRAKRQKKRQAANQTRNKNRRLAK